jgi:hypothetical protein
MKKLILFILIISNIAIINSCKKENPNDSDNTNNPVDTTTDNTSTKKNGIIYEGDTFHLSSGQYGFVSYGSQRVLYLTLNYENEILGDNYSYCYHAISFYIYTDADSLLPGNYTFSYSHDPFTFDEGFYFMKKEDNYNLIYLYPPDDGDDSSWGEIVSGTIKISKKGDIYEITFDGMTDYNKAIKAYFKSRLRYMMYG